MMHLLQRAVLLLCMAFSFFLSGGQTTNTYTTSTTWVVPAGVTSLSIKVYGGGGGTGGQDCGAGCGNAAAGNTGYVIAAFAVSPGNSVGIYPGAKGTNGGNNVTGAGGGAGGVSPYGTAYNGGTGGNAGSSGASGGGGGGGAASVVTINSVIKIVAGGAGGGGGMANVANSGLPGTTTYSPNGTSNTGGNGTTPAGDGGGGGGGGGGQYGSLGGTVYATGGESAGNGGNIGGNLVSGASSTTANTNIAWTNGGQIEITYTVILPVTWLDFNAVKQDNNNVTLSWSTASERNAKEFTVQRSNNGADWSAIGTVPATGNSISTRNYVFTDVNATNTIYYYRIVLKDLDGRITYSKILVSKSLTDVMVTFAPNPVTDGAATLTMKKAAVISIYNSNGQVLLQKYFPAGSNQLNVSQFARGLYFIKSGDTKISFIIQ